MIEYWEFNQKIAVIVSTYIAEEDYEFHRKYNFKFLFLKF
jgi:hypothetical protein